MYNMTWKEFLKIVYEARGMGADRKIISIPPWVMKLGVSSVVKEYEAKGIEGGLDPLELPFIMDLNMFIPDSFAKELGATEDDIRSAIFDSIRVSQLAFEGKAALLEMKSE